MSERILKIHPFDNVLVALTDLKKGEKITFQGNEMTMNQDVPAKHKFAEKTLKENDEIRMYGILVGKATQNIPAGGVIAVNNIQHKATPFTGKMKTPGWTAPDVGRWKDKTFKGYHRPDGQVGIANYWLVVPLVFCENRNVGVIQHAFEEVLGFGKPDKYKNYVHELVEFYQDGQYYWW